MTISINTLFHITSNHINCISVSSIKGGRGNWGRMGGWRWNNIADTEHSANINPQEWILIICSLVFLPSQPFRLFVEESSLGLDGRSSWSWGPSVSWASGPEAGAGKAGRLERPHPCLLLVGSLFSWLECSFLVALWPLEVAVQDLPHLAGCRDTKRQRGYENSSARVQKVVIWLQQDAGSQVWVLCGDRPTKKSPWKFSRCGLNVWLYSRGMLFTR